MIPLNPRQHRAEYDEDGNIILPSNVPVRIVGHDDDETTVEESEPGFSDDEREGENVVLRSPSGEPAWKSAERLIHGTLSDEYAPVTRSSEPTVVHTHLTTLQSVTRDALREGVRQYRDSFANTQPMLEEFERETATMLEKLRNFLTQPVSVPGRKNRVKRTSRGALFFTDIVRFGGTFAMIFAALFLTLNYQSYWQIATAQVEPLLAPPSIGDTSGDNAVPTTTEQTRIEGDLASYLPDVGPPDDILIIPKLKISVPIHDPPIDALMRKDWDQVEKDIQETLRGGVVHYPGTARAGQAGNFFITGHSSYYPFDPGKYKTVFARLHELNEGDEYWVYYNGDKHRYIVRSKKEVLPSDVTVLDQPTDARVSTLMTCTPVGTTLRRLIIKADEVDPTTGVSLKVGENASQDQGERVKLEALPI